MKKLITNLILFILPFLLYAGVMFFVDPFNYYDVSKIINDTVKFKAANPINYQMWKLNNFRNSPRPNIILGDSRANRLRPENIEEKTGMKFSSLSYGGGSLLDAINTFWIANNTVQLKNVYFGINFDVYNELLSNDNVEQAESISKNPFNYTFNKVTFEALVSTVKAALTGKDPKIGVPDMDTTEFWKWKIQEGPKRSFSKYKYPVSYYKDLKAISDYCRTHQIHLVFFSPPTYYELQKRISDFNLDKENEKFLRDIKSLGSKYYDFDYKNNFTLNANNFSDPVHVKNDSLLIEELFLKNINIAKVYN